MVICLTQLYLKYIGIHTCTCITQFFLNTGVIEKAYSIDFRVAVIMATEIVRMAAAAIMDRYQKVEQR